MQGLRIIHAIAQLRFGAGRYVVDTAIAQHQREPGRVAIVISEDAEPPWQSAPPLVAELRAAGVAVFVGGDFFRRQVDTLKAAAGTWRGLLLHGSDAWRPDAVVHAHTAMAATVARWAGAPRVVLTCHGWGPGRPAEIDLQDALAYSMCDVVTSPSEGWAAAVRERTALASIPVIPYGFNLDRFARGPRVRPVGPARIVCVGELSHRKGADLLLESMPGVWERAPETELHFVGDGELAAALRERAEALHAGTRVVFHGLIEQPAKKLGGFDVFALASRSDNQPVAIVEAMAAGLPIVSTRVGGIAEMIENARCGFVVPPEAVADLSTVLRVLAEAGEVARMELGRAGVAYVRAHHDVTTHLDVLEALYRPEARHTRVALPPAGEPVRLHVGCGADLRDGWVNIDASAEVKPDVVARAHELPMFADASVDTIESCHLFEHLSLNEARAALKEWARVLRPGGELQLELPNFEACVRVLGQAQDGRGNDMGMIGIFGWPPAVEKHGDVMAHRWGWTPNTLGAAVEEAGFGHVEVLPVTQTWRPATRLDRDFRIRAIRRAATSEAAA